MGWPPMRKREELLAREAASWASFAEAVIAVSPAERDEPTLTSGGWSVTTAVVHVAGWLETCARVLEEIGAGTWHAANEPEETHAYVEDVNRGHADRAAAMTTSDADQVLAAARDLARRAFEALADSDLTLDAWQWFEESAPLHYAKHEADIRAWLGGTRYEGSQ